MIDDKDFDEGNPQVLIDRADECKTSFPLPNLPLALANNLDDPRVVELLGEIYLKLVNATLF